jgi:broad specificity phosphatase PhoE
MLSIVLARPGSTEYDDQGRIRGTLDVPLSSNGTQQAARAAFELTSLPIEVVYTSPCQPAVETAEAIAKSAGAKTRKVERLQNLDQGLWQGKLVDEVRQAQPKTYKQYQDRPESVCPPQGEMLGDAQQRVNVAMDKIIRKHRSGVIVVVAPEPLASLVRRYITKRELGDLWKAGREMGQWEIFELRHEPIVVS